MTGSKKRPETELEKVVLHLQAFDGIFLAGWVIQTSLLILQLMGRIRLDLIILLLPLEAFLGYIVYLVAGLIRYWIGRRRRS